MKIPAGSEGGSDACGEGSCYGRGGFRSFGSTSMNVRSSLFVCRLVKSAIDSHSLIEKSKSHKSFVPFVGCVRVELLKFARLVIIGVLLLKTA